MEISRERRGEIIAALRKGTVPRRGLDFLAVGLSRFESVIGQELTNVAQGGAVGKLLSRPQLDQFYQVFRGRFGPDQLANLAGEKLLNTMHAHGNKDKSASAQRDRRAYCERLLLGE